MPCRQNLQVIIWSVLLTSAVFANRAVAEGLKRRGLVGVSLSPITDEMKERFKLQDSAGMFIVSVMPDSAAVQAGLKDHDIIIKLAGEKTPDLLTGLTLLRKYRAGDTINLTVLREGKEKTLTLTLQARPREKWKGLEVAYDDAGPEGQRVRTLVTRPAAPGKHPAILFIQSLGPQSIELSFPTPNPYRSLVESITDAGFVVMRVDRLGTGDSEGSSVFDTTVRMDIDSFRYALAKLKTYEYVDAERVFIFAHSTGAAIVPAVARAHPVRGVITYGATTRPWITQAVEMMKRRWRLELLPEDQIDANTRNLKRFLRACYVKKEAPEEILSKDAELAAFLRKSQILQRDEFVFGMPFEYGRELFELNTENDWAKVDAPVLALWGEADFIASREDSELIAEAVNRAHPGHCAYVSVPRTCHMFSEAEDMEESFLAGVGKFNPALVEIVTNWIKDQ